MEARFLRTWLWRHVGSPCVRLTLHPVSVCFREATLDQSAHPGFSPLIPVMTINRMSFVALAIKSRCFDFIPYRSQQLIFFFPTLSHCVHRPCLARQTTLVHLAASSLWCITSTTSFRQSGAFAEFQEGCLSVRSRPPLPCWTLSTMSRCIRADIGHGWDFTSPHNTNFQALLRSSKMWIGKERLQVLKIPGSWWYLECARNWRQPTGVCRQTCDFCIHSFRGMSLRWKRFYLKL